MGISFGISYEVGEIPHISISMQSNRKVFYYLREHPFDYHGMYFTLSNGEIIKTSDLMGAISATWDEEDNIVHVSTSFAVDKCRSDSPETPQNVVYFLERFARYDIKRISIMKSPEEGFNFDLETRSAPVFTRMYDVFEENLEGSLIDIFRY